MNLSRRKFIGSLISFVAAPAIVRVSSIMPVKAIPEDVLFSWNGNGYDVTGMSEPMNDLLKARLNECYEIISRAMHEMIYRDYGAIGFDPFGKQIDG